MISWKSFRLFISSRMTLSVLSSVVVFLLMALSFHMLRFNFVYSVGGAWTLLILGSLLYWPFFRPYSEIWLVLLPVLLSLNSVAVFLQVTLFMLLSLTHYLSFWAESPGCRFMRLARLGLPIRGSWAFPVCVVVWGGLWLSLRWGDLFKWILILTWTVSMKQVLCNLLSIYSTLFKQSSFRGDY